MVTLSYIVFIYRFRQKEAFEVIVGIIFFLVTLLSLSAVVREGKKRNFFGAGFSLIVVLIFGWFSIHTIIDVLSGGGINVGG